MDSLGVDLSFLGGEDADDSEDSASFEAGDRVRVVASDLVMCHVPKHPKLNPQGLEGEVVKVIDKHISANLPVLVKFEEPRKWTAHFLATELERA